MQKTKYQVKALNMSLLKNSEWINKKMDMDLLALLSFANSFQIITSTENINYLLSHFI